MVVIVVVRGVVFKFYPQCVSHEYRLKDTARRNVQQKDRRAVSDFLAI